MKGTWAAVDIGTHSIHLVTAKARKRIHFEILARRRKSFNGDPPQGHQVSKAGHY